MDSIWILDIEAAFSSARTADLLSLLPPERRERTLAYRFEADRTRSLFAFCLALYLIKRERGLSAASAPIVAGEFGKPRFADDTLPRFNLSHSGRWAVCGWSAREIGVDVQEIKSISPDIARRFFHPIEYAALLERTDETARTELFYHYWTLKESYLKYLGLGLQKPLDSFYFDVSQEKIQLFDTPSPALFFNCQNLDDTHKLAVCSCFPAPPVLRCVTKEEIWRRLCLGCQKT